MSILLENRNPLANPNNAIKLGVDVNCGCDDDGARCQANFDWSYDSALDQLTITDKSFLQAGDGIVAVTGISVTVTDSDLPTPTDVTTTGDDTAAIVVNVVALSAAGTFRIDYTITTDDGCTSTITAFFTPSIASEATGSSDYYSSIR